MKINIYTPTYHRFDKTMKSLRSIIPSLSRTKHDVMLYIGDNNSPVEMKETLMSLISDKVSIHLGSKNIGKAAMINYLHSNLGRPSDYVVSIDSDMIIPHEQLDKWIDTMVDALEKSQIGMVVTNQSENCCHNMPVLEERKYAGYNFYFNKLNTTWGIAGGCLMMTTASFNGIRGYHVLDVYNGDDALIMRKTRDILHRNIGVLKDLSLIHPQEENKAYQDWKINKAHGKIDNGPNTKGFFDAP
jgi:GT2 family glycosyltransferase